MKTESKVTWTKLSEKLVRTSPYYIQAEKQYRLPNGELKTAFVGHHKPFVIGMALTKEKEVILVKEYRPGPEKLMLDLPSGSIEDGEDPIEAMRRELKEETGWLGTPELVNITHTGPYSNQMRYTFVVHDCVRVGPQELDHDEFIEVVTMPLQEFYEKWVAVGETTNGAAVLFCLNHLGLLHFEEKMAMESKDKPNFETSSYVSSMEYDRALQEEYERGVFSPRGRVKNRWNCLVKLVLVPPEPIWDYNF